MGHPTGALALLILLLFAPLARAGVGFQHLTIPDPQGPPIEVGVWYPTDAPAALTRIALFEDRLAPDAAVRGRDLPLVVMSHGRGGSFADHRDTAMALAEAGFVTAALTHTGDNWRDHSRSVGAMDERPRQLKVLVDYMLRDWRDHDRLDSRRVGAFGFSSGGFTVLAAAGGQPDLGRIRPHCLAHPDFYDCRLAAQAPSRPEAPTWTHDDRIKAVVVAAPALGYTFGRDGLTQVRQPVQLWRAADDTVLPAPHYADAVPAALPVAPEFHDVPGADHYDFLAPCVAVLARINLTICASRPGFDRPAFHSQFNEEVVAFFRRTLKP
jgi:predicted dienelactone hydrolase